MFNAVSARPLRRRFSTCLVGESLEIFEHAVSNKQTTAVRNALIRLDEFTLLLSSTVAASRQE